MRRLHFTYLVPSVKRERYRVLCWLRSEWNMYADPKLLDMELHDEKWMRETGFAVDGDWQRQITQYWSRANHLGLDTLAGRQAMMKSVTTLVDACAAMIQVYGDPPLPGYPSGEIRTNEDLQKEAYDAEPAGS